MEPVGYNILVIEDEPNHQLLIRRELERHPDIFKLVQFASSGEEAAGFVAQIRFDCLLVDNRLPGQRGLELIKAFGDSGVNAAFVLMTSAGSEDLVVQAYRHYVHEYVIKETGFWQDLPTLLQAVIEKHQARVNTQERLVKLEAALDTLGVSPPAAGGNSELLGVMQILQEAQKSGGLSATECGEIAERLKVIIARS